jgi:hypothetical protein
MKSNRTNTQSPSTRKGSALVTVIIFIAVLLVLTGSLLRYSVTERTYNERNRLILRSRNMAENVAVYASEQLTTKLRRLRSPSKIAFVTGANQIYLPPDNVLQTENSSPSDVEVKAGLTSATDLTYIDPNKYPNDPNKGLQVQTATVQVIAKSTMRHPVIGSVTSYVEQDVAVDLTPLFQFGVFYNMDMEYGPGPNMTITGPVHTNGNLIARIQTGHTNTLQFADRVTAAGGFYANTAYKGSTWMADDSEDKGPGGSGPLYFTKPDGVTKTNIYGSSVWRDHKWGGSTESATSLAKFESFATSSYAGNLRTSVHGVTKLELPAVGSYDEVKNPTGGRELIEEPKSGDSSELALTKISRLAGLYIVVNPDDDARYGKMPDGSQIWMLGRSYRCFLTYVDTVGIRHTNEVVLPGQPSYGQNAGPDGIMNTADDTMYQNNLPNRYTDKTAIGPNQVLRIPASGRACDQPIAKLSGGGALSPASPTAPPSPGTFVATAATQSGMPSTSFTGYATAPSSSNSWPYYNKTSPYIIPDAYFFDIRRATNNTGHPWNRSSKNYILRPIAKIDFDMTRFRLAVERTLNGATKSTSIYNPNVPNDASWSHSILNASATPAQYNLGINYGSITDYSGFPTSSTAAPDNYWADPFRIYFAPTSGSDPKITSDPNGTFSVVTASLINTFANCPWSDGISIYIDSVGAEDHTNVATGTPDRVDSGVRLWNGRGPIISLDKGTYPKRTGFTLATNDAVYIVGHFNADGTINSNSADNTAYGGYSARYPDSSAEMTAAVMGDAITILSQPAFTKSGSNYYQISGWADSLSASRYYTGGNYSTSWASQNPSGSNTVDGINTSIIPASLPWYSDASAHAGSGSAVTAKFNPTPTEISSCLLTGIVRTTGSQTSGGVHNFPRLLEYWQANPPGTTLAIRGSMVALFESQVATEPWSIRAYQGAVRLWGLHQALRSADHDVPLEPVVIGAHRERYFELNADGYKTVAATIDALPH